MSLNHLRLLQPLLCRSLIQRIRSPVMVSAVVNVRPSVLPGPVQLPAAACRFYGTKKDKAKGSSAKVKINSALVEDIINLEEVKDEMATVVYSLKDDFKRSLSIRTSPGALDHIIVATCDGKFPLNELGQVSMKSSQLLIVNMSNFPEAVTAATHALRECSMNLNPEVDGTIIKVPIPKTDVKMGFLLSKSMDANFHKQQEFMLHNSRLQLERQIMMQNQMRERQMAMQIAWSREFLKYFGSFFALASVGLTVGSLKRRKPALLAPIIPLGFIFAYQMDNAYGTLLYRMRGEAESIMESERDRLDLPQGLPTFETIEKARRARSGIMSILEK